MASKPRRWATVPALAILAALALTAIGQDVDQAVTVHFVYGAALATSVPVPDRWTVYDDRDRAATVMLPPELIVHDPFIRIENLAGKKPRGGFERSLLTAASGGVRRADDTRWARGQLSVHVPGGRLHRLSMGCAYA
jgi:hypothetical protein